MLVHANTWALDLQYMCVPDEVTALAAGLVTDVCAGVSMLLRVPSDRRLWLLSCSSGRLSAASKDGDMPKNGKP